MEACRAHAPAAVGAPPSRKTAFMGGAPEVPKALIPTKPARAPVAVVEGATAAPPLAAVTHTLPALAAPEVSTATAMATSSVLKTAVITTRIIPARVIPGQVGVAAEAHRRPLVPGATIGAPT